MVHKLSRTAVNREIADLAKRLDLDLMLPG
jgi:hypothetical protein